MLRRIVSHGSQASDNRDEHMSPSPGDVPSSPDSARAGGLASVFKGLTAPAKLTKSPPPHASVQSAASTYHSSHPDAPNTAGTVPFGLSPNDMESFEALKKGSPSERIAAANSLRYSIAEYPLNPVLDIWYAAKDMIDTSKTGPVRTAGWELLTECTKHTGSSDLERREYFQTLSAPANAEDFHLQLAALVDLTNHGRELSGFGYDVIPLLTLWLVEAHNAVRAARKSRKSGSRNKAVPSGEEQNFGQLFSFVNDVVKFSANVADEAAIGGLIESLVSICMTTSNEEDLRSCIRVLESIITFCAIPADKLKDCIQVLSSIYTMVQNLAKAAWHTISILCKSHNGPATLRILLDVLRNVPTDSSKEKGITRDSRSALTVLLKLLSKTTEKGYPLVPFALLVDGLCATVKATSSPRILATTLRLINSLFDTGRGDLHPLMQDEDWSSLLSVAIECVKKAPNNSADMRHFLSKDDSSKSEDFIGRELLTLITRLEELFVQRSDTYVPRQALIDFFIGVHSALPDSAACVVLDYFQELRCCSPTNLHWQENLQLVVDAFFANRKRSSQTRLKALQCITDAYEMMELLADAQAGTSRVDDLVKDILKGVAEESDIIVLEAIVSLMASIAGTAPLYLFEYIADTLRGIVVNDRMRSPISPAASQSPATPITPDASAVQSGQTPSNVVARGYVQVFQNTMDLDGVKAVKMINSLVNIAKTNLCETDARLTAMKLLFRLRADWASRVFLVSDTESDGLAATLYRTKASLARKQAIDASQPSRLSRPDPISGPRSSRGISFGQGQAPYPVRNTSGAKQPQKYQPLWLLPDPEALPEEVKPTVSPILVSHCEETSPDQDKTAIVPIGMEGWLEALLYIFQHGCDWEVFSFVLVHLPSQLTNHAIFRNATDWIMELRRTICEHIRLNSFQEPPNSSGLRRADVAICLFHSLTMILSYHEYFQRGDYQRGDYQRGEEDEMVRTFVHGIGTYDRSSKYCIHALSICCHELPLSTSKSLVQLLQKMAQIVTQQEVAIHILEFLACLSRMPNLYVNFREDEFRIVFGICFRYLQSVRDRKQSNRNSQYSEPSTPANNSGASPLEMTGQHPSASDDLPQYVYALAYHVITFWFLALRLPDRANHVGWIAKNLFTDVDGGQIAEEQALITIDFMQRVAYADADESSEDPLFTQERFGEILKRRWIIGNSIVTVEQATGSGWAQITKRQPSGTASYTVREAFRPPPPHQTRNVMDMARDGHVKTSNLVLPSHLLVQLMSSIPQTFDALRPIPLPEDEAIDRAIRMFDRSSTVDGHKVGVIYIGEGQTDEKVILANVSGSSDYVDFLNGLGTLTKLKGATFNTQGLDRVGDADGQYTFCWRDRVTEIVFHVTTQMPTNLEHDSQCINKKKHIGNDYVNIIFNDSGLPFRFDTFPSEFNFVNIVITPESRASFIASREEQEPESSNSRRKPGAFYKVQVMSKPGFPGISPASDTKMVSLKALPDFIRLVALNASVFSLVWSNREGGEHVGTWRNRLREIKRLREKYGPKLPPPGQQPQHNHHFSPGGNLAGMSGTAAAVTLPPLTAGATMGGGNLVVPLSQGDLAAAAGATSGPPSRPTSSVRDSFSSLRRALVATFFTSTSEQTSHRSSVLSTTTTDTEIGNGLDSLVESVDFSKWA